MNDFIIYRDVWKLVVLGTTISIKAVNKKNLFSAVTINWAETKNKNGLSRLPSPLTFNIDNMSRNWTLIVFPERSKKLFGANEKQRCDLVHCFFEFTTPKEKRIKLHFYKQNFASCLGWLHIHAHYKVYSRSVPSFFHCIRLKANTCSLQRKKITDQLYWAFLLNKVIYYVFVPLL